MLKRDHSLGQKQYVLETKGIKKLQPSKENGLTIDQEQNVQSDLLLKLSELPLLLKHEFIWAHWWSFCGAEMPCKYSSYCFYFKCGEKYFSVTKSALWFFELDRKLSLQLKFRSCKPWKPGQSHGVKENIKSSKVKSGNSKKNWWSDSEEGELLLGEVVCKASCLCPVSI